MSPFARTVLLAVTGGDLPWCLTKEVQQLRKPCRVMVAGTLAQARMLLASSSPDVMLLDESVLGTVALEETVRQLASQTSLVVVAAAARLSELAEPIAEGAVEFVARTGDFLPLAAALLERRLRWAESAAKYPGEWLSQSPVDFASVLRHEINNPLTGILGNAELLLAHRDRLPAPAIQRLQTVVDLAVRLRETIRRLSAAWEKRDRERHSA
jgi:signal transduction histidine kinase